MDRDEQLRSAYQDVLRALNRALSLLERPAAEGPNVHDAQLSAIFHLGESGGLAFSGLLPGIGSEALFDDISDAVEEWDLDEIGRIQRAVATRLGTDRLPDEASPSRAGLNLEAGYLQMLAVLNEARTARTEGDDVRYSLMSGFLVGLMSEMSRWGIQYRHGTLADAVLAAYDRNLERAREWVRAESIEARKEQEELEGADSRPLLLGWVAERLAAANRFSCPTFFRSANETKEQREAREASERAYYEREETSIQRAQNFGKRITSGDDDGIWVPTSHSLNRALVLESHEDDGPIDIDREE